MRRIGVLTTRDENDPVWKPRLSAFTQELADLGWTDGRNLRVDLRGASGDINQIRALAAELVGLQSDMILTGGIQAIPAVQRKTRTLHDRLVNVSDPVAHRRAARPPERECHRICHQRSLVGGQVA